MGQFLGVFFANGVVMGSIYALIALGFSPNGDVFKPGTLPRQEGKAVRVFYENGEKK